MRIFLKIFQEGIYLSLQELWSNKLRTFLSLLGITIGIFCVISVISVIDSFEKSLRDSFNRLGDDVVYVMRESWQEDPGKNWWKYIKRPYPSYSEFRKLQDRLDNLEGIAIRAFLGTKDIQYQSKAVSNVVSVAATYDFGVIYDLDMEKGRYFTREECFRGNNQIILGHTAAQQLFGDHPDPVGKSVRFAGRKVRVTGVLKKEGQSLLGDGLDNAAIVPYNFAKKFMNLKSRRRMPLIAVKAGEHSSVEYMKDEIRGVLRAERQLRPKEDDNFEFNQLSILTGYMDSFFGIISIAGLLIGGFALVVGGFGIANIMFVSVRERTKLIGIKKALGAKRIYILLEFLTESVILTLLGGLLGILIVALLLKMGNSFQDSFHLFLSLSNASKGILISILVGIVSGFIPAFMASKMDPVEAIRH